MLIKLIGWFLSRDLVFRAIKFCFVRQSRVYWHLMDPIDPSKMYMGRWWIIRRRGNLPCIRLHWINKADTDRHLHSHPFNFRTFILKGWYREELIKDLFSVTRIGGDSSLMPYGGFHRIASVSPGGCWTLFIMWGGKRGDWGFETETGYVDKDTYFKQMKADNGD